MRESVLKAKKNRGHREDDFGVPPELLEGIDNSNGNRTVVTETLKPPQEVTPPAPTEKPAATSSAATQVVVETDRNDRTPLKEAIMSVLQHPNWSDRFLRSRQGCWLISLKDGRRILVDIQDMPNFELSLFDERGDLRREVSGHLSQSGRVEYSADFQDQGLVSSVLVHSLLGHLNRRR